MKSYNVFWFLSLAIVFFIFSNPLLVSGEVQFCPGSFKAKGTCAEISCGNLALFHWPASKMSQKCKCDAAGSSLSNCTCQIVCQSKY
ncbi:unnamed protein product [Withania somnifera]